MLSLGSRAKENFYESLISAEGSSSLVADSFMKFPDHRRIKYWMKTKGAKLSQLTFIPFSDWSFYYNINLLDWCQCQKTSIYLQWLIDWWSESACSIRLLGLGLPLHIGDRLELNPLYCGLVNTWYRNHHQTPEYFQCELKKNVL